MAACPDHSTTADELLLTADHALDTAEGSGRNRIMVADGVRAMLTEPC